MGRVRTAGILIAALALVTLGGCDAPVAPPDGVAQASVEVSRANGEALFRVGGCASCHASAGQAGKRPVLGGGRSLVTNYGTFRAPNISPHESAGIGGWSLEEFDRAMRAGLAPDGHAYFPAFPYDSYVRMSGKDIADLFAFIATLPASPRVVEASRLAFPTSLPGSASGWRRLYLRPGPAVELEGASEAVARGQFLVEGPGHCGTCHTPRTALGGPRLARWLGGAEMLDETGYAPNLTPHEDGLAGRSAEEIVEALRPYSPPDGSEEGMDATRAGLSFLPESDLYAIAAYLMALPPVASAP